MIFPRRSKRGISVRNKSRERQAAPNDPIPLPKLELRPSLAEFIMNEQSSKQDLPSIA